MALRQCRGRGGSVGRPARTCKNSEILEDLLLGDFSWAFLTRAFDRGSRGESLCQKQRTPRNHQNNPARRYPFMCGKSLHAVLRRGRIEFYPKAIHGSVASFRGYSRRTFPVIPQRRKLNSELCFRPSNFQTSELIRKCGPVGPSSLSSSPRSWIGFHGSTRLREAAIHKVNDIP